MVLPDPWEMHEAAEEYRARAAKDAEIARLREQLHTEAQAASAKLSELAQQLDAREAEIGALRAALDAAGTAAALTADGFHPVDTALVAIAWQESGIGLTCYCGHYLSIGEASSDPHPCPTCGRAYLRTAGLLVREPEE